MMNSMCAKIIILAFCFVASGWGVTTSEIYAQAGVALPPGTGTSAQSMETALVSGQAPSFVYNRERPDPFFPFLTQEIIKAEAKAKAELTGTRKFEPAQLTLVAIVSGKRGFLAMVQDSSGAGYLLRKGTKIGEMGEVVLIAQNKVVIEQKNVTGERTSRKVEMILNKEGEK